MGGEEGGWLWWRCKINAYFFKKVSLRLMGNLFCPSEMTKTCNGRPDKVGHLWELLREVKPAGKHDTILRPLAESDNQLQSKTFVVQCEIFPFLW